MTQVRGSIKIEYLPNDHRYVRLLADFYFYSDLLARWCCIPAGFIFDLESIPVFRGNNPEAGTIHDYLCRTDSDPVVPKFTASKVYEEFQACFDALESGVLNHCGDWLWARVKTGVVMCWPGYFHKFTVMATYEEITGNNEIPVMKTA